MITLNLTEKSWINGATDDPNDQCAHGRVHFQINSTLFVDSNEAEWAVSACALYLLRTIENNNDESNTVADANFIFPCCGFSVFRDDVTQYPCYIQGCPNGKSPNIRHENNDVIIELDDDCEVVSILEWASAVLNFADQVEAFYNQCSKKVRPEYADDAEGWDIFWQEWRVLKQKTSALVSTH